MAASERDIRRLEQGQANLSDDVRDLRRELAGLRTRIDERFDTMDEAQATASRFTRGVSLTATLLGAVGVFATPIIVVLLQH